MDPVALADPEAVFATGGGRGDLGAHRFGVLATGALFLGERNGAHGRFFLRRASGRFTGPQEPGRGGEGLRAGSGGQPIAGQQREVVRQIDDGLPSPLDGENADAAGRGELGDGDRWCRGHCRGR